MVAIRESCKDISPVLVIRADAGPDVGVGHVMRCLSIAQAWAGAGGKVIFVCVCHSDELKQRIRLEGFELIELERSYPATVDLETVLSLLSRAKLIVVDGYHFDPHYQKALIDGGFKTLFIEDQVHHSSYHCTFFLSHHLHTVDMEFPVSSSTTSFVGPRYALIRNELVQARRFATGEDEGRKVLLTLGGGNNHDLAMSVLKSLGKVITYLDIRIVVGPAGTSSDQLSSAASKSHHKVTLLGTVKDMGACYAWADVAIAAAGGTCMELAFMGTPSVILATAENQNGVGQAWHKAGAAVFLGAAREVESSAIVKAVSRILESSEIRNTMREAGQSIVDGLGPERIVRELLGHTDC